MGTTEGPPGGGVELLPLPPLPDDVVPEVEGALGQLPAGCSVVVTGSIVEGFGNRHSDVDLYAVLDDGRPDQPVSIGMRSRRYVDCEFFVAAGLERLSAHAAAADWPQIAELRRSEVDRYYRLTAGAPVRLTSRGAAVLGRFRRNVACRLTERWSLVRAWELTGRGAALAATGREPLARLALTEAAWFLGTSELAALGEGYPSVKWLGEKAARRLGRGTPEFAAVVDDALRPPGVVRDQLARLRERLPAPSGLLALLAQRACTLAPAVRVSEISGHRFLVHRAKGLARPDAVLAPVVERLAAGAPWADAVAEAAVAAGVPIPQFQAAAWHSAAVLRTSGHLVEGTPA